MKKAYLAALLPGVLLLNGCNNNDTETCRYYIQQDLDSSDYLSAINRLNKASCQSTYPDNEFFVDLGTAYLGKAGLNLPKIMATMIDDSDNTDSNQFSTFVKKMAQSASDSALLDLTHSRTAFSNYLDGQKCKDIVDPSSTEDGVCLLTGFVDILKTTMAIDSMTAGDITHWSDNESGDNPAMLRSTCALQYAFDHKNDSGFSTPYTKCKEGVSVEDSQPVTFTLSDNSTQNYNSLSVSYQGEIGYFLESEESGSTIFTKDYCQNDYSICDDPSVEGCYACPVNKGTDELTINDFVLDALNSGFDNIETIIANAKLENSDELQESIDEFKTEIKSEGCQQIPEGEDCFTLDDIIGYLNKE